MNLSPVRITYKSDWHGGRFLFDGKSHAERAALNLPPIDLGLDGKPLIIKSNPNIVSAKVLSTRIIHGTDSDHGSTYRWEFTDYVLLVDGTIPTTLLTLLELNDSAKLRLKVFV